MDVKFRRKVVRNGKTLQTSIPPELIEFLGIKEGNEIVMTGEQKTKGKFISIWRKDQKDGN